MGYVTSNETSLHFRLMTIISLTSDTSSLFLYCESSQSVYILVRFSKYLVEMNHHMVICEGKFRFMEMESLFMTGDF